MAFHEPALLGHPKKQERRDSSTKFSLFAGGRKYEVEAETDGDAVFVSFDGKMFVVSLTAAEGAVVMARLGQSDMKVVLDEETETTLKLAIDGRIIVLGRAQVQLEAGLPTNGRPPEETESNALISPMFGKVISIEVKAGDSVEAGQPLLIMEAMKMESILRADGAYVVKAVLVKEGDGVDKNQVLIRFA